MRVAQGLALRIHVRVVRVYQTVQVKLDPVKKIDRPDVHEGEQYQKEDDESDGIE